MTETSEGNSMGTNVHWTTPPGTMVPIGPYSHIAQSGPFITIGAIAGVDPATGQLAGPDVEAQTEQIIDAFEGMLASVGSDLDHILHITVFLADMVEFERMNDAYSRRMGGRRPPRSAVEVSALPKPGARVTMNLMAVVARAV